MQDADIPKLVPKNPEYLDAQGLSLTSTVRSSQIAKVIKYMTDNHVSMTEACRDLGYGLSTIKRWLAKDESQKMLEQIRQMETKAAVQVAASALVDIVEAQVGLAKNVSGTVEAKDMTRAATFIERFLSTYGSIAPKELPPDERVAKFKNEFVLSGPITMTVTVPKQVSE